MVPPEMTSLLPPEPAPLFKYRQDDGETNRLTDIHDMCTLLDSAEGEVAVHLLEAIKNKESIDDLRAVLESLTEVGKDHQSKRTLSLPLLSSVYVHRCSSDQDGRAHAMCAQGGL